MTDLNAIAKSLNEALGGKIAGTALARGELTVDVQAADILEVMTWLQGPGDFKILVDVCGNDWPRR